jgi:hypothetical protein
VISQCSLRVRKEDHKKITECRFLAALDKASVEAPRSEYLQDALSCIHCLNQRQKTSRLHAFLPLIPSCGEIGHALSLAELGTARSQCTTNLLLSKPILDLSSSVERVPLLLSTPSFPMDHVFCPIRSTIDESFAFSFLSPSLPIVPTTGQ